MNAMLRILNMPDPIGIGSAALARSGPDDSCTPACFRTGSVWPKPNRQPEPDRIHAGFAQYNYYYYLFYVAPQQQLYEFLALYRSTNAIKHTLMCYLN